MWMQLGEVSGVVLSQFVSLFGETAQLDGSRSLLLYRLNSMMLYLHGYTIAPLRVVHSSNFLSCPVGTNETVGWSCFPASHRSTAFTRKRLSSFDRDTYQTILGNTSVRSYVETHDCRGGPWRCQHLP